MSLLSSRKTSLETETTYNVFYVLLLEYKIIKKGQVNKWPEPKKKFEVGDNKKYKVKPIINNTAYGKEANNHMLDLYYHVL